MQRTRYPERRRTTRLSLQIPLTVRCRLPEGETIDLKASTYSVSANGALVLMDTPLIPGQNVRVINEMTSESADCFVTSLREKRRSEEHTSELQSQSNLVCRLLLEKKKH